MRILLLRHGETAGNRERRYVGKRTDEGLTAEETRRLEGMALGQRMEFYRKAGFPQTIYASPMRRCMETAALLFPPGFRLDGKPAFPGAIGVPGLEECDFGRFEYKNYMELNGDLDYQRFIDSGGLYGFPDGETVKEFKDRSVLAFSQLVLEALSAEEKGGPGGDLTFVAHGGTIMAVMEAFAVPKREYYSWQTETLSGFTASVRRTQQGFLLADVAKIKIL